MHYFINKFSKIAKGALRLKRSLTFDFDDLSCTIWSKCGFSYQ